MKKSSLWILSIVILLASCKKETSVAPVNPPSSLSEHYLLGNPSGATSDTANSTNFLLEKKQFVLSYHRTKGIPNWVSWHLDTQWLGSTDRQDDFRIDGSLPANWYRVKPTDYTGSGFDRGHLCPSADRTSTLEDNSGTFLMSNMMPQAPNNNRITWENLESYGRKLVGEGNELYIIAGPLGMGGSGSNGGITNWLAGGKIAVPASTWKVILVLPKGEEDEKRITTSTRLIAVHMPNTQTVKDYPWQYYRISVDELEVLTGYDFFSILPTDLQKTLEASVDNQPI